jgi:hypothetical protein
MLELVGVKLNVTDSRGGSRRRRGASMAAHHAPPEGCITKFFRNRRNSCGEWRVLSGCIQGQARMRAMKTAFIRRIPKMPI